MLPLIPPFIQQRLAAGDLHGELQAFTLNIDLSGFTPLTETLMKRGLAGAERLSVILNEVFEPLVALAYAAGGFIPYFAGDAFTAVFPLPLDRAHAMHMLRTAERARQLFRERGYRFGGDFRIGIKAGIAAGTVRYGIVGTELRAFYFRGEAINAAAACQSLAGEQEIVIDDFVHTLAEGRGLATEGLSATAYRIVGEVPAGKLAVARLNLPEIDPVVAAEFLPPEVVRYDQEGEFRSVVSCFLSFDAVNTHEALDHFATAVLKQVKDFGGYFKEVDYGDKGALMVVFFGAPVTYENNMARAVEFSLVVQQELEALSASEKLPFRFRMGLTVGTAFTGIVGGKERAQYACVGNRVNLAARIMAEAEWTEVLVDGDIAGNGQFRFMPRGNIRYKGVEAPEPTFVLEGRKQNLSKPVYGGQPVGRDEEVSRLLDFALPLARGATAGLAYVFGEAGIGKSRLTYEFRHQLQDRHPINWLVGNCDQILRKPFNPFVHLLQRLFRQSNDLADEQNLRRFRFRINRLLVGLQRKATDAATRTATELRRTESILAAQLGIQLPDSLWTQLDAQGRYQNTIDAIANLLIAECLLRPTVLELEDVHWIDEDSLTVLRETVRRAGGHPLLVLATARPSDTGDYPRLVRKTMLEKLSLPTLTVEIGGLDAALGCAPLRRKHWAAPSPQRPSKPCSRPPTATPFTWSRYWNTSGKTNSSYSKTVYCRSATRASSFLRASTPSSPPASIGCRIWSGRRSRAAAVIGREFDVPVLTEVLRTDAGFTGEEDVVGMLEQQIQVAERGQIWSAMNELRYIFRHSLLREAVYGMQLTTRLQQLHLHIARAIEKLYADSIEERFVDLAFHYEQSGETDKTVEYLSKAASYARANYRNQQALDLYRRLIQKMSQVPQEDVTINIHLSQGGVYEIVGRWEEAKAAYEEAQQLAKSSRDVVLTRPHQQCPGSAAHPSRATTSWPWTTLK